MPIDFSAEYSNRNDDELLQLASERHSLTPEATAALDTELRRRNLTESDRVEYQRFVKRQEQREARRERTRRRRWKFGALKDRLTWHDLLFASAAIALILFTYFALPRRDRMKPDWQDAAVYVMIASVVVAVACRRVLWRKLTFWMSLLISSAIHLVVVHAFTQRLGDLNRIQGRGALFLGFVLFLAVYGSVRFLRRMLYGKEVPETS